MHKESFQEMERILSNWKPEGRPIILDVGSFNVNGSLRPIVEGKLWDYIGIDLVPGKNVDIVAVNPYHYQFDSGTFDAVISANVMEHVVDLWKWVPEVARLVKPGGLLAILTLTHWHYHPHPVDCWRIMPDGMRILFDSTGCLENYDIEMYAPNDIRGVATKCV